MKTALRWTLNVGLVLTSGVTGLAHTVVAASSEASPAITIHVRNYAGVAPKTLAEAEEVATDIFRKAGLETRWADVPLTAENSHVSSANYPAYTLADIELSILPREMSVRSGLPNNVMGLVPGTDAQIAYVFADKVETLFQNMLSAQRSGHLDRPVSKAQILGHAIAHELGHLLLDLRGHSAHGIMRGEWGLTDMRDAACELLLFTSEQAEVLRADVRRRNAQEETLEVADLGISRSPR